MPNITAYESANFSNKVYSFDHKQDVNLGFGVWKYLTCTKSINKYGYYACAFKDEVRNLIVIVHRGTHLGCNFISDGEIALNRKPDSYQLALDFSRTIRTNYNGDGRYQIVEVGHSLGGFYAELNGAEFPGTWVRTFESPGCRHLLSNIEQLNPDHFIGYFTAPNPVNVANAKFGKLIRIYLQIL